MQWERRKHGNGTNNKKKKQGISNKRDRIHYAIAERMCFVNVGPIVLHIGINGKDEYHNMISEFNLCVTATVDGSQKKNNERNDIEFPQRNVCGFN